MSRGAIWVKDCNSESLLPKKNDNWGAAAASNKETNNLHNNECMLIHRNDTETNAVSGSVHLRRGEIGVFGCVSSRILPLVNLNERTADINLMPGEYASIRCVNAFGQITDQVDVICDRALRRVATRNLRVSQFVIITCDRPLPLNAGTESVADSTKDSPDHIADPPVESVGIEKEANPEDGEEESVETNDETNNEEKELEREIKIDLLNDSFESSADDDNTKE